MTINNSNFNWKGTLSPRHQTEYIILHHRAGTGDVQSIHNTHLANGWTGIGYHFYVRKDGSVYSGRPIETIGAHCTNHNSNSIGVCFEGNFENDIMSSAQLNAAQKLILYLKNLYPSAVIKRHSDFNKTACPGKNFPYSDITDYTPEPTKLETVNDIIWELNHRGIVTDKNLWLSRCKGKSNAYWLAYKIANYTTNLPAEKSIKLITVNDIVWELNFRGIITDTALWLKILSEDDDLYWLAYKTANLTKNK